MKLSIIMPCYNVEKTLGRALDSVLMQQVDFEYEIIIVNDASKDNTRAIADKYAKSHSQIRILNNRVNSGTARSFYNGFSHASGEYFCVLDGDDYYTVRDKLKRQIDFLDKDIEEEYVAVATHYLMGTGKGLVHVPWRSESKEFNYVDYLTLNTGYYHTATYMFRNIFRGNIPEYLKMKLYEGDTPLTTLHLMYSRKKVRILDFVGSVYTYEYSGIWSSMKENEQTRYQINYLTQHRENVSTAFEKKNIDVQIEYHENRKGAAGNGLSHIPAITIEACLKNVQSYASKFAFGECDFTSQGLYYSQYIDSLCESLGYIWRLYHPETVQQEQNENNVCIINGVLGPENVGIRHEIKQLIRMFKNKNVYLFVTNMNEIPEDTLRMVAGHENVTLVFPPEDTENKLEYYTRQMKAISPYRAYYYCSHDDVYAQAIMHAGACQNVCLFSFDHGYLCGITNSNLDTIIAKRPVDYYLLKKKFGDKVIYIPTWDDEAKDIEGLSYEPFKEHDHIITASGAARYYKLNGCPPYRYEDCILELLKRTKGIHYHYGQIPKEDLERIYSRLENARIPAERFVVIEWADNLPRDLLLRHVDIFIEPFPVVSYKMTLSAISVGVPVLALDGIRRMSVTDFLPEGLPKWRTMTDFIYLLSTMSKEKLHEMSQKCQAYFTKMHAIEAVRPCFLENRGFDIPNYVACADMGFQEVADNLRLFGSAFQISIMDGVK